MALDYLAMFLMGLGIGCLVLWLTIAFTTIEEDEEVWDVNLKLNERQYQFLRTLVISESKTEFFTEFDSFRKPHSLKPLHEDLEDYEAMLQVGLVMNVISEREYNNLMADAKSRVERKKK